MSGEMNPHDLETALRQLVPRPSQVPRERLIFLAGRASAAPQKSSALRLAALAASWLATFGIGWMLGARPFTGPALQPATPLASAPHQDANGTTPEAPPLPIATDVAAPSAVPSTVASAREAEYLQLRRSILAQGLDSWRSPPSAAPVRHNDPSSLWQLREAMSL